MVRSPSIDKNGLKRGQWSKEEDDKLTAYIKRYGIWNWRQLPSYAGLSRCGKSCRLRWKNYLQPNVKRGNYTKEEEDIIVDLHDRLGKKWSIIAKSLPGRTDNEIKNYWHTHLKKRTKLDQNPTNSDQMVESSQGNLQKLESSSIQTSLQELELETELCQYSDNDQQQIMTEGLISPNESLCSEFSRSHCSAPFNHDCFHAKSFESPQGSCCSELSLNSTFSSLGDLTSWEWEDSNIIGTSFESFDYYWGQTFNHETDANQNEGQFVDPGLVRPDSPITEEVILWSW